MKFFVFIWFITITLAGQTNCYSGNDFSSPKFISTEYSALWDCSGYRHFGGAQCGAKRKACRRMSGKPARRGGLRDGRGNAHIQFAVVSLQLAVNKQLRISSWQINQPSAAKDSR